MCKNHVNEPQCHTCTKKQKNIMKEKEERHLWHCGWPMSQCHQPQCHPSATRLFHSGIPTHHTLAQHYKFELLNFTFYEPWDAKLTLKWLAYHNRQNWFWNPDKTRSEFKIWKGVFLEWYFNQIFKMGFEVQ